MARSSFANYRKALKEAESARLCAYFLFTLSLVLLLFCAGALLLCSLEGFHNTFWFGLSFPLLDFAGATILLLFGLRQRKRAQSKKRQADVLKKLWLKEEGLTQ